MKHEDGFRRTATERFLLRPHEHDAERHTGDRNLSLLLVLWRHKEFQRFAEEKGCTRSVGALHQSIRVIHRVVQETRRTEGTAVVEKLLR